MAYETSAAVFELLNVESITAVSNGVSPFVRNRSVAFPAVVFDINSEEFENTATEVVYRTANVDVQCLAKSQETADAMVDAVISRCSHFSGTLAGQCVYSTVQSVSRDYEDAEDSSSNGIYISTVTLSLRII
jgi:hypothetical protein